MITGKFPLMLPARRRCIAAIIAAVSAVVFLFNDIPLGYTAGDLPEKKLPSPSCGPDFVMDKNPVLYMKDNLYERINGESELYFPYGFELLASARYIKKDNPRLALEIDIYRMGSLLDAFGIYSNYRRRDDVPVKAGVEGIISMPQVIFYQDRYFVRLQSSGDDEIDQSGLLTCAESVSGNLPRGRGRPLELDPFMMPGIVKNSERYIPQSILGYEFFKNGIIAEAVIDNGPVQVFLLTEENAESAGKTVGIYAEYIKASGKNAKIVVKPDRLSLECVDPLYGIAYIEQYGRYVIGVVRAKEIMKAKGLARELREKIAVRKMK